MKRPDDAEMATVEEAVDNIREAQHPDGYVNPYYPYAVLRADGPTCGTCTSSTASGT